MRTVRAALTFSLVALSVLAFSDDFSQLKSRLDKVTDAEEVVRIVEEDPSISADPDIDEILLNEDLSYEETAKALKDTIEVRTILEQPSSSPPQKVDVKEIKSSPAYRDTGVDETSNWLARALERLKNLKWDREPRGTDLGFLAGIGPLLYYGAWTLIAAALMALIYFAVKHFRWRQRLERRAAMLMEDSEPERTLDEWLTLADSLEAEGRYREAVRALYLACLLRFDEALVARFERSETNWEHLYRIEKSPKRPDGLDFRSPTQLFDQVWYGHKVRGKEDVAQFRNWYVGITDMLRPQKVAA